MEEEITTYSSILAWRLPWTGEPGRLQSMGLQRVGHEQQLHIRLIISVVMLVYWGLLKRLNLATVRDNFDLCKPYFRRRQWHPTPVLLPGKSHGRRSLVGCSPWGCEESDMTEQLHCHFSLSCIGEGNGNPLQCSCLENPRDGGAWWAAVYGVAQSQTRLKRHSSSSSSSSSLI